MASDLQDATAMDRQKEHREDQAHDVRTMNPLLGRDGEHEDELDPAAGRSSYLWRAMAARPGTRGEEAEAAKGMRGNATALPYRAELESQLGTDLSHVKAYVNGEAADALGAEAYATPDGIVFGNASPTKELVAHEVVHMHQQRGTGAVEQDEAEADAIGGRLAAGEKVGRDEIKSGGGKVRKKGKKDAPDEQSLVSIFKDFVKSIERTPSGLAPRAGSGVDNEKGPLEKKSKSLDIHGDGTATKESQTNTVERTGLGFKVSSSQTFATGLLPDQTSKLEHTIVRARETLYADMAACYVQGMQLDGRKTAIEQELAKLKGLDEYLVAGKQLNLVEEHADIGKRQKALEATIQHQKAMIAKLDQEVAALSNPDESGRVLERLAKAEAEFKPKSQTTINRSFGFDLLAGEVARSRSVETQQYDADGKPTTATTNTSSQKLTVGGGVTGEQTWGTAHKNANGATVSSDTSVSGQAIAKDDGTVGFGGGLKLTDSIENSHGGKATTATGLNGAVTTNIIAVPKQDPKNKQEPQLYAVVVTINLGLATQLGLSKVKKNDSDETIGNLGVNASVNVEAQLTQTKVLDAATATKYLEDLQKAGTGDATAADKAPEFSLLHKAMSGIGAIEQATQATLGSGQIAQQLAVGDSTEITLKAGAGISGSAGLGPIAASGGTKGEQFRTLKIGRVAGKAKGSSLVEITVSFGRSGDTHGGLTASGLGIEASVGGKWWNSNESAVTFQLDETEKDYDALYSRIVNTTSLDELAMLRTSEAFAKHVLAWSKKTADGDSTSLGAKVGQVGLSATTAHDRSTSFGKDREGKLAYSTSGATTDTYSGSLGPLEMFKSTQKSSATYEIKDDVRMLDVCNLEEFSSVGQFGLPSVGELISAESPIKAFQKKITVNRKRMAGFMLDPYDLEKLAERAGHWEAWSRVPVPAGDSLTRKGNIAAWEALGAALRAPTIDPEHTAIDPDLAREMARGDAVATFFSKLDHARGHEYMRVVLRENHRAGGDGTDIGHAYEFPPSVDQAKYIELRYKGRGLDKKLASFLPDRERGPELALNYCTDFQADLAVMIDQLTKATDFNVERSRVEMIGEMRQFAQDINTKRRDFLRSCSGTDVLTEEQLAADSVNDAKVKVRQLEGTLAQAKQSETRLFQRGRAAYSPTARIELHHAANGVVDQLEQLYEIYVPMVKELRAAYIAAGTKPEKQQVRLTPNTDPKDLDIDILEADLMLQYKYGYGYSAGKDTANADYNKHSLRWEKDLNCF